MFIGRNARTFEEDAIIGYGPRDGLPRNEISCHESFLRLTQKDIDSVQPTRSGTRRYRVLRLEQALQHDALYKAYPGMRRARVMLTCPLPRKDRSYKEVAGFLHGNMTLYLWEGTELPELHKSTLHEVQHGVQAIEGFTPGMSGYMSERIAYYQLKDGLERRLAHTSHPLLKARLAALHHANEGTTRAPDAFPFLTPDMVKLVDRAAEQIAQQGHAIYLNHPGEMEARRTEERLPLTPTQRREMRPAHLLDFKPPYASEFHDNAAALAQHRNRALQALPSTIFNALAAILRPRRPAARSGYTP